jgi:hypothetical protein
MIHCKRFLIFVALAALCTGGHAYAQTTVSDSDFMSIYPTPSNIRALSDTTFKVAVVITTKTPAAAFTIPLTFATAADLRIDTTVVYGGSEKGISMGPAGASGAWTIRTALPDNANKTMLIGFISFGVGLPPTTADTLVYIHFDHDANATEAVVTLDSTFIAPSNNLTLDDAAALSYIPQWTPGVINIATTGVSDGDEVKPFTYGLDQNYPNPFNAGTKVSFSLAAAGKVDLKIYNMLGQAVKVLVSGELPQGLHNIVWDGTNNDGEGVGSGTYFYRLKVGDVYEETRQMTLLK